MNVRFPILSVIALTLVIPAFAADDAKKELARWEGTWQIVSGEENGEATSEYLVTNLRFVFKGDQLVFKGDKRMAEVAEKSALKIDASTKPGCVDIKVEAGTMKGTVLEGIYEWKGDELRLCLSTAERERPVEFATKAGSNRVMFVLKREKQ